MIVKILQKPSNSFAGVNYNAYKVDKGKAELMLAANFGALQAMNDLRPQDHIHYLKAISAANRRGAQPQLHVVFSSKGQLYDKETLTDTAVKWLAEMGYGRQPYLITFHNDTDNNHVHAVTTRIGRDGKKINSAFEKVRAVKALDKVLGYEYALTYNISTRAQFYLLLETAGYAGKDYPELKLQKKIAAHYQDKARIGQLKILLDDNKYRPDLIAFAKNFLNLEIILHAAEGKAPYGYTLIDHETLQVFKGSEILSLRYLFTDEISTLMNTRTGLPNTLDHQNFEPAWEMPPRIYIRPVSIADDIDDEAILGRNRRRKKKARTNNR